MRCPKCGFISFDHLTSCAKCGKDIADVAMELQGTSIRVETPMFLSGALAAFADRAESFEDHAAEAEVADEGIDFSMEEEAVEEEAVEMAEAGEDVDFSFEEEEAEADMSLAEAEEAAAPAEEEADFILEAEAEEEPEPAAAAEESFEELDFMGAVDDEEEGGLEFDLEDFIDDIADDKSKSSSSDDIDLDLDEEEKK